MKLIKKMAPAPPVLTLREFYERRNKILIVREVGGLGDILMHRMMFEDFKAINPEFEIVFACPKQYHPALTDHPYIDTLRESRAVNIHDYIVSYNTTSACTRYEIRVAPFSGENRSDIWAGHCGVTLKHHNMHIKIPDQFKQWGQDAIQKAREGHKGPCVMLCPISAMIGKNLTEKQMGGLINELKSMGYFVCASHTLDIPYLRKQGVHVFTHTSIPEWMGLINASDYVISVDSAAFHFAGGIGKPLMGIFTFADGKVYGKYYDFVLVQKHRDNGDWDCGPCYNWALCPKKVHMPKPCLTEITVEMLMEGIKQMFKRWPNRNAGSVLKLEWNTNR